MLIFGKFPGTKPCNLAGQSFTRSEGFELCLSMVLWPSKGDLARAGDHSASYLSLTLILHLARMPDGPVEKPGKYDLYVK